MPKQRNGPHGKPPAPLVKRRPVGSFSLMVRILKSRKPRRIADAELLPPFPLAKSFDEYLRNTSFPGLKHPSRAIASR
jgi:hypothetical protein